MRPRGICWGLLGALGIAALAASDAVVAEDNPVSVPEIRVIANTPLAPPSPRRAPRAAERPTPRAPEPEPTRGSTKRPSRQAAAGPRSAAPSQAAAPAAPAVTDPALIERDKIPANVQTLSAGDFDHAKAPDLLDAISRGLPGVALDDQTGNEFQRDLNYRGFVASPVIGTPQGLAVYQNGVRVNEVFGDIVNWDFIPETAINRMTLMPSNPVFGLNALGGAIAIDMKNGFTYQGIEAELRGGSFGRRSALIQEGGQVGNLSGYVAADAINDDGWRLYSPSQLRRIYADLGARGEQTEFHVTFTGASNNFGAAAATPIELLNRNWASVYTVPQATHNQLAFLTASGNWNPTDTLSLQANAYYRGYWQRHVDGNGTSAQNCPATDTGDDSDQGTASQPAFLCFPDLNGNLSNLIGLNGLPVVATDLLADSVLGEIDRTSTAANSLGGSFQAATRNKIFGQDNRLVLGASSDNGHVQFNTSSELGTINADTWPFVQGVGVYIDQPSGDVAPSGVLALTRYTGLYTTDTFDVQSEQSHRPQRAAGCGPDLLADSVLGEIDRTSTAANSLGGSFQAATRNKIFGQDNRLVLGASSDNGHVQFNTSSELGTINADTWPFVQGVGVYIDQPSGDVAPSGVLALTRYTGLYTTDTFDVTSQVSVTFGGRYNIAQIGLRDTLGNNAGLNGDHGYSRLNPVIGATFKVTPNVTAYAGYSEANRAPTPLELGCSDPLRPSRNCNRVGSFGGDAKISHCQFDLRVPQQQPDCFCIASTVQNVDRFRPS